MDHICILKGLLLLLLRENFEREGPKRTREISEEDVDVIHQAEK